MLQKRFGTNFDSVSLSFTRSRYSADIERLSLDDFVGDAFADANLDVRRFVVTHPCTFVTQVNAY